MNYKQTLNYLYSKLPMFTRVGAAAFKKDLYNTIVMCEKLGNPQEKFKTIHVGGTNGKGSTSHMLAAIFQQAGFKTGLYTSPHLKDFRERIRINGAMISKDFVIDFIASQGGIIDELSPSFFEVTVAMAFSYFETEQVDIAIVEVGLGGRLDSTNIITPELSVITNISLDHTNILGSTLVEIAAEKAGIIKQGIPVVIGERHPETDQIFLEKAKETRSEIVFADEQLNIQHFQREDDMLKLSINNKDGVVFQGLELDLTGSYQLRNILTVIQSVLVLNKSGYGIGDQDIRRALRSVKQLTGLQGRWQVLGTHPLIICDTGHNIAGITEVVQNIRETPHDHLHIVIGMVKDKDIGGVLKLLPEDARYYFCQPDLERALSAAELARQALDHQLIGDVFPNVRLALTAAKNEANDNDLIFIGGSTFVVAEVL